MTFDIRSWAEIDGFFSAETTLPSVNSVANIDVPGQHIRSIVDPFKMVEDAHAALSWFVAQPNLQANNIGVWATSFGGSLALVTAANSGVSKHWCLRWRLLIIKLLLDRNLRTWF